LYILPNIIRVIKSRRMIWAGHVAHLGEMESAHKLWCGKFEGRKPLVTPRHRWEDNIITDLEEIGWEGGNWIHLAQDRDQWWALVNMVMNFQAP
jgi:hypothetical protein